MRIIVLSDSHGDIYSLKKAIDAISDFDAIIHLGDIASDVDYLEAEYENIPIYSVLGNNDFFRRGDFERTIELGGEKIFICHGHTLGVHRGYDRLVHAARRAGATVALYGHTHCAALELPDGILVMNPGSTSRPREGNPSFGVLEYDGSFDGVIVDWAL